MDKKMFDVQAGDEFGNPNMIEDDRDDEGRGLGDVEWEDVPATCPECGHKGMKRSAQANGPDDYDWYYECMGCGSTWS